MAELLVRASWGDHKVVSDLLAGASAIRLVQAQAMPIDQLVADAHVAEAKPILAELAQSAGIPYIVDPNTPHIQSGVAREDRWGRLPFGRTAPTRPEDLDLAALVEQVVDFQLDKGATVIIPPYFYAASPDDSWFAISLRAIAETQRYMERNTIRLSLMPIFCGRLQSFGNSASWDRGVDQFVRWSENCGATTTAMFMSPAGETGDHYGKVRRLFDTAGRAQASGLHVIAWRQGIYGPGLVAAGLAGYECGMGTGEKSDVAGQMARRRKGRDVNKKPQGGPVPGVYLETLGRSVVPRVANALFSNTPMRARMICDQESCCAIPADTLNHPRHHAVRARSRLLTKIGSMSSPEFRLSQIAREASSARTIATQANGVLAGTELKERIDVHYLEAIEQVCRDVVSSMGKSQSA
jgi:hypothetical protein